MKNEKNSVEVVIPIYNEETELAQSVQTLWKFLDKNLSIPWQITIVDNASTDQSLSIAQKLKKELNNINVLHLTQKGRGRAVKTAWVDSSATILAYMDVDLSTELTAFPPLLVVLQEDEADIAIASRLLPSSRVVNRSFAREIISRLYNLLLKTILQVRYSDAQCGCKAITKSTFTKLASHIENNEWFFDTELLTIAEKSGFRIYEHPVVWRDNPGSTVRVLPTMMEDLQGVLRLLTSRPWRKVTA